MRRSVVWMVLALLILALPHGLAGAPAPQVPGSAPAAPVSTSDGGAVHSHANDSAAEEPPAAHEADHVLASSLEVAAMRGHLTAFLADLDVTVAPYRTQPHQGAASDASLGDALAAVRDMPDEEIFALYGALSPLLVSWAVIDAQPTARLLHQYGPVPFTPAQTDELDGLRDNLLAYYDRFLPLTDVGAQVDPNFAVRLASLRSTVETLTLDELAQLNEGMASVPTWETLLDVDPNQVIAAGGQPHASGGDHASNSAGPKPSPGLMTDIHPQCKDMAFGPTVTAILNYLANTAEDLSEIWSNDFFIEAAGFGANVPNIPKIITMVIYYPLKIVALAATVDQALFMNCNEGYHQALFGVHDGEMLELTDLISGTLTSIDLSQNNRFDRVDQFHASFRETEIRQAIEEDLIRKGDKRISLFQIPESLCITDGEHEICGMLETAHDIVAATILTAKQLGLNTDAAEDSFADGEDQQAQGFYKEAYTRYREAYVRAVRAQ